MKCIFVATTYKFLVQYHPWAVVEASAHDAWPVDMEGSTALYRMLREADSPCQQTDGHCAVFVPDGYTAHAASLLILAFTAAHPGVIPRDAGFELQAIGNSRLNRLQRWPAKKWAKYKLEANAHWNIDWW